MTSGFNLSALAIRKPVGTVMRVVVPVMYSLPDDPDQGSRRRKTLKQEPGDAASA